MHRSVIEILRSFTTLPNESTKAFSCIVFKAYHYGWNSECVWLVLALFA
ncbi:unnamed protein product [Acidithrix sp. C25]|nr:unnamed protein product [Acidithrix sp. C25]